jgi:hypothetical protein
MDSTTKIDLDCSIYLGTDEKLGPDNNKVQNGTLLFNSGLFQQLYDVVNQIKDDENISGISININGILGNEVQSTADQRFTVYQNGLQYIGEQIQKTLVTSGVDANKIKVNANAALSITTGAQPTVQTSIQINRNPPTG